MVRRIEWMRIPRRDFDSLDDAFYYCEYRCKKRYATRLIELAEKYKYFATDYDGKRFVFVSVENSDNEDDYFAGFVVYDKSSKKVLLSRCSKHNVPWLEYYMLVLRLAMDNRLDILEHLLSMGHSRSNYILSFFGFCYKYLGDEFIEYLYKNSDDIIRRLREGRIIYGRNFVLIPRIGIGDYGGESAGFIRAGDGSIVVFGTIDPERLVIVEERDLSKLKLHRILSYIIDHAEELERNIVLYENRCSQHGCWSYVFSSASPPHLVGSSAIALVGQYKKYSAEELDGVEIFFIECDDHCVIYPLSEVAKYLIKEYEGYPKHLAAEILYRYRYDDYVLRFLEYVIGFKERFPPKFVRKAYMYYLDTNVMNVL
ncbi:MAG: hypothetical protein C0179_08415 [Fervidicoccus sp.]|nr:MAG: hypothetical protein C0179_08415 [Fervidicoccus sp.]